MVDINTLWKKNVQSLVEVKTLKYDSWMFWPSFAQKDIEKITH